MHMKRILAVLAAVAMMAVPAGAETVHYEDEFVSFDYTPSTRVDIYRSTNKGSNFPLYYSADTQMYADTEAPSITIMVFKDDDNWQQEFINNKSIVSKDPLETFLYTDDYCINSKVIGTCEGYVMRMDLYSPFSNSVGLGCIQLIYDTAAASDDFAKELDTKLPKEFTATTIFQNVIYSEEGLAYIRQAINICDGYLKTNISGDEAEKRMTNIIKALEDLKENSNYCNDSDLYYAVWLKESRFGWNDDAGIVDLRNELEQFFPDETE